MDQSKIGKWVKVELVNGTVWNGRLEEWDEDAVFISNGFEFGHSNHKGAECANSEVKELLVSDIEDFTIA